MQCLTDSVAWERETSQIGIIQSCINHYSYKDYLEIGVQDGTTFFSLDVQTRTAVEPEITPRFALNKLVFEEMVRLRNVQFPWTQIFRMKSDEFFAKVVKEINPTYDVIFVDGYHEREQVVRDIKNALNILEPSGTIFVHDTNPLSKEEANPLTPLINQWTGDVWRGIIDIRCELENIELFTIPIPYGLTVIRKEELPSVKLDEKYKNYTYEEFDQERDYLLNIKR